MLPPECLQALADCDFHTRYYDLCDRYPLRAPVRFPRRAKDVMAILGRLARSPSAAERGRAFEFRGAVHGVETRQGFILQSGDIVEFWCSVHQPSAKVGDTLAVLARAVTLHLRLPDRKPPYSRPTYTSLDELEVVLTDCFALGDQACEAIASSRPTKG
jgi:hypothetical protein